MGQAIVEIERARKDSAIFSGVFFKRKYLLGIFSKKGGKWVVGGVPRVRRARKPSSISSLPVLSLKASGMKC